MVKKFIENHTLLIKICDPPRVGALDAEFIDKDELNQVGGT